MLRRAKIPVRRKQKTTDYVKSKKKIGETTLVVRGIIILTGLSKHLTDGRNKPREFDVCLKKRIGSWRDPEKSSVF